MIRVRCLPSALALTLISACAQPQPSAVGQLAIALEGQASGVTYRLRGARFQLEGPESRELAVDASEVGPLPLTIGSYELTLKEGWTLHERASGEARAARLISQNPQPLVIGPGATTHAVLRFELEDGRSVTMKNGELQVSIAVGPDPDAAVADAVDPCLAGLVINEVDYDQAGADTREFIEIAHGGSCPAPLADVFLELINGGDRQPHHRVSLARAATALPPGKRLVVGTAAVLAGLAANTPNLALSEALQNGPDALRLVVGGVTLDALSYEGAVLAEDGEGQATDVDEGELSLSRCPDAADTNDNAHDFALFAPTPGDANACP